jgi:tRNA nucleotidyltransferase (CCA-adding enzyme)
MDFDERALFIIRELEKAGHRAWLVGGCVRDALLGLPPADWDVATSARPQETRSVFGPAVVSAIGEKFGTLGVNADGLIVEVTAFRAEAAYLDSRHPSQVSFSDSLEEDLSRRDFTINAIAFNPRDGLYDPHGGVGDLERGRLRCVGDAHERLSEDALRIMRALRFMAVLGLRADEELRTAVHQACHLLTAIAPERLNAELMRMLAGEDVLEALLEYPDVLAAFIPEVGPCVKFDQRSVYHDFDVWEHTARAMAHAPADPLVRLALLFHDLGKPPAFTLDSQGHGHFKGHDLLGAQIASKRLKALRFDKATAALVSLLVQWHSTKLRVQDLPRWLSRLGYDGLKAMLAVKRGDILAHSALNMEDRLLTICEVEQALAAYMDANPCYTRAMLAIDGNDVMATGVSEGREVGAALDAALEAVLDGRLPNERAALLDVVKGHKLL